MKLTLLVTQDCNLACGYCYIGKRRSRMPLDVARRILDFGFPRALAGERIDVGFFGGEPLLELALLDEINDLVEHHPQFSDRIVRTVVTNGTIFTDRVVDFFRAHDVGLGISCDGPPDVHDGQRRFVNGNGSGRVVERTIRFAVASLPGVMVNAVYGPDTVRLLPSTVDYLSSLGVRCIYLTPNYSACWRPGDLAAMAEAYRRVADSWVRWHCTDDPHFISLIDSKIAVILRDGYQPLERCRMGCGEFAFTPAGDIYPCERLVGDGGDAHRIGNVRTGLRLERLLQRKAPGGDRNRECETCSVRDYCMHWCGCSNFFATGSYNRVSEFLCASEKAALHVAQSAFESLEAAGVSLFDHLGGAVPANVLCGRELAPDDSRCAAGPDAALRSVKGASHV